MYAKNYQNRAWSDKVIAEIKWCNFLTHMVLFVYIRNRFNSPMLAEQTELIHTTENRNRK